MISGRTKRNPAQKKKKKEKKKDIQPPQEHMACLFKVKEKTLKITFSVKRDANIFVIIAPDVFWYYLLSLGRLSLYTPER